MIPSAQKHHVATGGALATGQFDISKDNAAFVMSILRSQIYTDKPMAVIREYSANAWDANKSIGRGDVPIRVHLPQLADPWLRISDDGPGLSRNEILTVYTQYGASTKRNDNDAVGMLGIGSKAAFCYTDKFNIISCHDGIRSTYVAALDESNKGCINLMHEEPCGDATGIEIQVSVEEKDFDIFQYKAQQLFVHFSPAPQINTTLAAQPAGVSYPAGIIRPTPDSAITWVAVMGCIPYRIDLNQLQNLPKCVHRLSGVLKFHIGDVEISASREELTYTDRTKAAIATKIDDLLTAYIKDESIKIESAQTSQWEKRLRVQELTNRLQLTLHLPTAYKDYTQDRIEFAKTDNPFAYCTVTHDGTAVRRQINISKETYIVVRDDMKRSLKNYRLDYHAVLVVPNKKETPLAAVEKELDEVLEKYQLTGVKIVRLSTLPWYPRNRPYSRPTTAERKKHSSHAFVFVHRTSHTIPLSESWEVVERRPRKSDIFVVLKNFKTDDTECFDVYERIRRLKNYATAAGVKMPPIYGYKTTLNKPVAASAVKGTRFTEWEANFLKTLCTKSMLAMHDIFCWSVIAEQFGIDRRWRSDSRADAKRCDEIIERLGPKHTISKFINLCTDGAKGASDNLTIREHVLEFAKINRLPNRAQDIYEAACEAYPLVRTQDEGFGVLWKCAEHVKPWLQYIEAIDRVRNRRKKETT